MIIQHNMPAINAHRQMGINTNNIAKSLEKLSSGYRINRAGDDAAGLAISEKMRGQISGLNQAKRNSQDGISLIQTAEGNLQETHAILQRMRELAVQSANGTYDNSTDRANLDLEVKALKSEIDRIASSAEFNGRKLLDGTMSGAEIAGHAAYEEGDIVPSNSNLMSYGSAANTKLAMDNGIFVDGGNSTITLNFVSQTKSTDDDTTAPADKSITATWDTDGNLTVTLDGGILSEDDAKSAGTVSFTADEINAAIAKATDAPKGLNVNFSKGFTVTAAGDKALADGLAAGAELDDATEFAAEEITAGTVIDSDIIQKVTGDTKATSIPVSDPMGKLVLQIGANGVEDQRVALEVDDMSTKGLKIADISIGTRVAANDAIDVIDEAINKVSSTRADLGALQNRLEHTINNLGVYSENLTAAESRIRDVDMAAEMMSFTKNQILQQASRAMLAQANALPQGVLQLLQ